jgi:hypothetical protein
MILELLALAFFIAAAVVAGIQRSWPLVLLSVGASFVTLAGTGLIHSGAPTPTSRTLRPDHRR